MREEGASCHAQQLQLPPSLQLHILSLLPPNDRALSGRLVSPDAAAGLSGPEHCSASLSQPLPTHAVHRAIEAGQQHVRQLRFRHKVRLPLLCRAARSGSEVNMEVAWAVLKDSSVFPELLQREVWTKKVHRGYVPDDADPGVEAVVAGHLHLLPWLLFHCPGQVNPDRGLEAAARHCDLAGLQEAWHALSCSTEVATPVLDAAAASPTPDAIAKMEWILAEGNGTCSVQTTTAAAAARSGDLGRLRWLRDRGCPMDLRVLRSALGHADLAVAQWLVEEGGVKLPEPVEGPDVGAWEDLLEAAVWRSDGVSKLQWLWEWGAPLPAMEPPDEEEGEDWDEEEEWHMNKCRHDLVKAAIEAGQLKVVQHLLSVWGPEAVLQHDPQMLEFAAAARGSIPMAECLREAGLCFTPNAYESAAICGHLPMVRWLLQEESASPERVDIRRNLIWRWRDRDAAGLLQAVQLLVREGSEFWRGHEVLRSAARRGDLALVQYLLQQQPELQPDGETFEAAADAGCHALLQWLTETYPHRMSPRLARLLYIRAAKNGDRRTLEELLRLGVRWGERDTVASMVAEGARMVFGAWEEPGVPALRWLVQQGMPVGSREELQAAVARRAERRGELRFGRADNGDDVPVREYLEALLAGWEP